MKKDRAPSLVSDFIDFMKRYDFNNVSISESDRFDISVDFFQ